MHYVTSDIHGDLGRFKKLLNRIKFNPQTDKMVILGDVVDRGAASIETLNIIRSYAAQSPEAMELILGNHEYFIHLFLTGQLSPDLWDAFGGAETRRSIEATSETEREMLDSFIMSLPLYTEIHSTVLGGNVLCTHAGLHSDYLVSNAGGIDVKASICAAYRERPYELLCGNDLHYLPNSELSLLDRYLIVGHVPVSRISPNSKKFFRNSYYMDIDMGSGYIGGALGCYVVETDEEIIIK